MYKLGIVGVVLWKRGGFFDTTKMNRVFPEENTFTLRLRVSEDPWWVREGPWVCREVDGKKGS